MPNYLYRILCETVPQGKKDKPQVLSDYRAADYDDAQRELNSVRSIANNPAWVCPVNIRIFRQEISPEIEIIVPGVSSLEGYLLCDLCDRFDDANNAMPVS